MKKYVQVFVCFLVGVLPSFGRAPYQKKLVNHSTLILSKDVVESTTYEFDTLLSNGVQTAGLIYYSSNFSNDNLCDPNAGGVMRLMQLKNERTHI
ncbi:hypothetical protein ACPDHL_13700 [Myroides sp. C15-4]|uniref:hypothetical protein n=1 Tax=Myroides sp. C15-4 TaxID=3400532 RepID=UPI003D2F8EC5